MPIMVLCTLCLAPSLFLRLVASAATESSLRQAVHDTTARSVESLDRFPLKSIVAEHNFSSLSEARRRGGTRRRRRRRRRTSRRRRRSGRRRRRSQHPPSDHHWIPVQTRPCSKRCNAYVSSSQGQDEPSWGSGADKPFKTLQYAVNARVTGQTIFVMAGTYRNIRYGEGAKNDPVVNLQGVTDLVIKSYGKDMPKIEFDSSGGFVGKGVERVIIEGLEIVGLNANITYSEAMAGRLSKEPRLAGRGIAIWGGHHIQLQNLNVHHCPGSGIRVNRGDYILLSDSKVFSNCWWSSSAESAIVFAEAKSIDDNVGVKMVMRRNKVYDNMNKVPYYNPTYEWYKSPIASGKNCQVDTCNPNSTSFDQKQCPWQCQYGKSYQDYIVDGMGVYVTRNNLAKQNYTHGRMELTGNIAHGNGINGLVFHRTDRGSVSSNVVYDNGVVPRDSKQGTKDWQLHLGQKSGKKGRQPYAGITINNAHDVKLANNVVLTGSRDDAAYAMEYDTGKTAQPVSNDSKNNSVCLGKHFDESLGPSSLFVFPGRCTDNGPSFMKDKGLTCASWDWALKNKCNKDSTWVESKYCQRSCYVAGVGYADADNRCCFPYGASLL